MTFLSQVGIRVNLLMFTLKPASPLASGIAGMVVTAPRLFLWTPALVLSAIAWSVIGANYFTSPRFPPLVSCVLKKLLSVNLEYPVIYFRDDNYPFNFTSKLSAYLPYIWQIEIIYYQWCI